MRFVILASALALAGCVTTPGIPASQSPTASLVPEEDLVGRLYGRGEFRSINGVRRAFDVTLDGDWDGKTLTLVEAFRYADGQNDTKTWKLTKLPDGRYAGVREDVVGTAEGWLDERAYRMAYTMAIPKKNGGARNVRFQDVLVEDANGAVINRAKVSYFGFPVASVDLVMQREPFS
ncbi:MAG: DUF3833 family protein [Hyphomonadaceae bacterium]|nr:DUF3833 family protein [Hyphomonadaceae bacterium]